MRILKSEEIVEAASRYATGETLQSIADDLGVTLQAVWHWVKHRRMGVNGFRELRNLRHQNVMLKVRLKRRAAGWVGFTNPALFCIARMLG